MNELNLGYKGNFNHPKAAGKLQLSLVSFEDDDHVHYVYCPALDLTGYGYTDSEAKISFEKTLELYMDYTINKETFAADLIAHGWNLHKKKFISPPFGEMLKQNKDFENIVEKRNFTKFTHELEIPDYANA